MHSDWSAVQENLLHPLRRLLLKCVEHASRDLGGELERWSQTTHPGLDAHVVVMIKETADAMYGGAP
jgi:hypothetical protein